MKQGLEMMKYLMLNPEEFERITPLLNICICQFTDGFFLNARTFLLFAIKKTADMAITLFVAFHVHTAIDKIYVESFSESVMIEDIENPLILRRHFDGWVSKGKSLKFKIIHACWWIKSFFTNHSTIILCHSLLTIYPIFLMKLMMVRGLVVHIERLV